MGVPSSAATARSSLALILGTLTPAAVWAIIVWVMAFWRPGPFSLLDPDEAHYAQITREMLRAHRWLVPLLDGAPYFDKPVLFHWLQAAAVRLIGESELALRLPSACAAVALLVVVRWAGSQLFGSRTGNHAAVMFATLPLTFVLASVGLFDMVFAAFLVGAIVCLLVASLRERRRLEYPGWTLLALAVMTKGPLAVVLVVLFGAVLMASRRTRFVVTRLRWASGLAFVLIAASPWFVYMSLTFPEHFVRDYLLAANLWYFTGPAGFTTRHSDLAFYVRTFAGAFFPWSLIAVGRGGDALRMWRQGGSLSIEERVLWTWTLVVLGFFTVARFKLDTYIFPAAPAVAMLAAFGWQQASNPAVAFRSWTRRSVLAVAVVLVAAGLVASLMLFRINLGLASGAMMLPAAMCAGGILLGVRLHHNPGGIPRYPVVTVATLLFIYGSVVLHGLPALERSRPTATIGRWVRNHSREESPLGVVGLEDWRASLRYYADRTLLPLSGPDAVQEFLHSQAGAYVVMRRQEYLAMRESGSEIRAVGGRPAILGRTGKYIRRQEWGRLVVVRRADAVETVTLASVDAELDLRE